MLFYVPVRQRLCLPVGANTAWAPHRSLHPRAHIRRPRRIRRRRRPCRRSNRRRSDFRRRHDRRGTRPCGPAAGGPRVGGDRGCAGGCRPHARRPRRRDEAAAIRQTRCFPPSIAHSLRRDDLVSRRRRRRRRRLRRRRRRVVASPSADTATRRSAEEESRGRPEGRGGLAGLRGSCGRLRRVHRPRLLEVRRAGRDFVSGSGSGGRDHCATAAHISADFR